MTDHHGHRHTLLAGLTVNGLDEWDINNLGWLKADKNGNSVTSSLEELKQQFSPSVESCAKGHYSGFFSSGEIDRPDIGGRTVTDEFPFISAINVWHRHIEMKHKESPFLALTIQHRSRVGVVVQFSNSHLSDFTGLLFQDSFSHLHLNLSLVQASGTINGEIFGNNSTQSIQLYLPAFPSNTSRQVKLIVTECFKSSLRVILRPLSHQRRAITKDLPCLAQNLRIFRSTPDMRRTVEAREETDCLCCGSAWLHWIDPDHWLETAWPQTRVVIMVTMAGMGIIISLMACSLCKYICNCLNQPKCKISHEPNMI